MTEASRTFEVMEYFKRIHGTQLKSGEMHRFIKEEREAGLRFVVENIAKEGSPAVYADHSREDKIPFTEEELNELQAKFIIVERFPRPKMEE